MERQFYINWPATVEEAKQRRKTQRLTQARLAKMAGVSMPTISRFESGEKDIQLSSVISILSVLGMNDQRTFFFHKNDEFLESGGKSVVFYGQAGNQMIRCEISIEVLQDHFDAANKNPLKIFQAHRDFIQHQARRKYLNNNIEHNNSIMLKTQDIEVLFKT